MNNTTNSWEESEWMADFAFVMESLGAAKPTNEPEKWENLLVLIEAKCRAREEKALHDTEIVARAEIKEKISYLKRWVATIRDGENPACDEYVVRDKELKEILSALSKE